MERKQSSSFIGGAAAAAVAAAGGTGGAGGGAGGVGGMGGGIDRRVLVEWHPFLSDFFVAGGEELQLYAVRRERGPWDGGTAAAAISRPRYSSDVGVEAIGCVGLGSEVKGRQRLPLPQRTEPITIDEIKTQQQKLPPPQVRGPAAADLLPVPPASPAAVLGGGGDAPRPRALGEFQGT